MSITQQELNQAFEENKSRYGGIREDYFALLFLIREFGCSCDLAASQVAFGNNDYGIDGFHIDVNRRNLYLYQFKWSENHGLFKDSYRRLIDSGFEKIFGNAHPDQNQNQVLLRLRSALIENQSVIDRVFVHFVFNGDPGAAEQNAVLDSFREDLEAKKFLIDSYFDGRKVSLIIQYISNKTRDRGSIEHIQKTHQYQIKSERNIVLSTPSEEKLFLTPIPLGELYRIYREMGQKFFERNIRSGLSPDRPPNRAIRKALARFVLDQAENPENFAFNHNGVTLYAQKAVLEDGGLLTITEPRLLNGAQTVTSLAKFMEENTGNPALDKNLDILDRMEVFAKIITDASQDFVTGVTICNNRQNPVEAWHLRANDRIQLEFQDKFRTDLGIYYERQEKAFENLTYDDLEEMGIEEGKAIQLRPLAQTFLAIQGEIDRISRLSQVFEHEKTYKDTFRESYLKSDSKKILFAYKIQFRLRRVIREITEKGSQKYFFLGNARNLIWALLIQGAFNDEKLDDLLSRFGNSLVLESDFTSYLRDLASRKLRFIISEATSDDRYQDMIKNEKYSFLRTKATFQRCMTHAKDRYDWQKKSL